MSCLYFSCCLIFCLFQCHPTEFHLLGLIFHLKVFTAAAPWPSSSVVRMNSGGVLGWRRSSDVCKFILCVQVWAEVSGTSGVCTWRTLKFSCYWTVSISVYQDYSVSFSQWTHHRFDIWLVINEEIKQMQIFERRTQTSCVTARPGLMLRWPWRSNYDDISHNKTNLHAAASQNKDISHMRNNLL